MNMSIPPNTNVIQMPVGTEKKEPDDILKTRALVAALAVELEIVQLRYDIAVKELRLLQLKIQLSDASIASGGNSSIGGGEF
jgi:hypothetical protein